MAKLAEFSFDETSGPVIDHTGNGHGWTLAANTVRTASGGGHTDKGLTQTTSGIDVGPAIFGQTPNRSMTCWIKNTGLVTDGRLFEHVATSDGNSTWEFLFRDASWHLQAWNATAFGRATTARPTDNLNHHFAGTYDGSNLRLYKDAVLVATTALAGPLRTDANVFNVLHTTSNLIVVDDARFYDTALSLSEITSDMNTPAGTAPPTGRWKWNGTAWVPRARHIRSAGAWT